MRINSISKYKALICITTSNRARALSLFAPAYAHFVAASENFSFVVALDGNDASTLRYCSKYGLPVLYSDEREGVGLDSML